MFGLGMPELILILVLALVFFGPAKLPELGSAIGKTIREFRQSTDEEGEKRPAITASERTHCDGKS